MEIFAEQRPADKVIEKRLKAQPKWGSRDRKFFAETVYDMIRHLRRLWFMADLQPAERDDFRGLFEPEVWRMWRILANEKGYEIPDWPELKDGFKPRDPSKMPRAVRHSIPDWMDRLGQETWGGEWDGLVEALNRPALVYLRTNTLKTDRSKLLDRLAQEDVETEIVPELPDALVLPQRKNVFVTKAFKEGIFEVQDAASQTVAPMLSPKPGERVIDACAGAGGKTLHLAALMKNKGSIIALDIHQWKLDELKQRARRNGVHIVETRAIDSTKVVKRLEASADAVLLDVPCSGMGVLRRNPDSKWRLSMDEIARLRELQADLLARYSRMTKPGGRLVYATCSVLPSENGDQVRAFLASPNGKGWSLVKEQTHRPDKEGYDGFYAALLSKGE